MDGQKQQSPNWDEYRASSGFVEEGFPFEEGFPTGGPYGNAGKLFEILFRDGTRYNARVAYGQQYMADGIQWKIPEKHLDEAVIVAWKEL